jgi:acetyl-CoA synthetase
MKEGRDQWLPLLDQASDNNVAEIMDAEDPLFILILRFYRKTKRNGTHYKGYMVYSAYTFKNVLIMKTMIFFALILVGLPDILYSLWTVIEWSYDGNFEGVFRPIQISASFWQTIEKHKVTQFYTAPTARALAKASNMYKDTN